MVKKLTIHGLCLAGVTVGLLPGASIAFAADAWDIKLDKLKGRIVRSLSIAPFDLNKIIVGNKGTGAGAAIVFASDNGGLTWRFLNRNSPLHPDATDVQAVRYLSPEIVLAGTWQHGLFRSTNAGVTFGAVGDFTSTDVRSLASSKSDPAVVYAATGADGILRSADYGATWVATALDRGYFWSVQVGAEDAFLTASSPSAGLFVSQDKGESWNNVLQGVKASDAAFSPDSAKIIVAATDDGMYLSLDSGAQWSRPAMLQGKRLSSVHFDPVDSSVVLLGDWNGGIWRYSLAEKTARQYLADLPVVHVDSNERALFVGSWGKGLHVLPRSDNTGYLIDAAKAGDEAAVTSLLSTGVNPDVYDEFRNTALIFAARDGHLDMASRLVEGGASVNWIDSEGVTPLILAAHKNHPKIVELLLAHGADTRIIDSAGNMAEDYAKRRGESDFIYRLFLKNR